jgi:hypothetical protein
MEVGKMKSLLTMFVLLLPATAAYATDLCAGHGYGPDLPTIYVVTPLAGGTSVNFQLDTNNHSDSMVQIGPNAAGGGDFNCWVCETSVGNPTGSYDTSQLVTHHDVTVNYLEPLNPFLIIIPTLGLWRVAARGRGVHRNQR